MGSIGLPYSILQTYLTNAWLDHRWIPLLYGFLQLERLSPEEAKRKKNMRALERIAKREMQ